MAIHIQSMRTSRRVQILVGLVVFLLIVAGYAWYASPSASTPSESNEAPALVSTIYDIEAESEEPDTPPITVDPEAPVRLKIDSIGVNAPIIPVGTEPDGAMSAPSSASDIGWYEKSATVGSNRRAMLLSGHYGLDIPEVLYRLNELKVGDTISVHSARGDTVTYRVVETERRHRTMVDMEKAYRYGGGQEAVSIITCIGEYDYSAQTYDDRYIVYALRIP